MGSAKKQTDAERFWSYVDKSGECWIWTKGRGPGGYGFFCLWIDGKDFTVSAHRYAYTLVNGPIPPGMTLDHACHTAVAPACPVPADCPHRACVRPGHLVPMPLVQNIRLGGNAVKTHCKHGHEFTPENTWRNSKGHRWCRACARVKAARIRAQRKQPAAA